MRVYSCRLISRWEEEDFCFVNTPKGVEEAESLLKRLENGAWLPLFREACDSLNLGSYFLHEGDRTIHVQEIRILGL